MLRTVLQITTHYLRWAPGSVFRSTPTPWNREGISAKVADVQAKFATTGIRGLFLAAVLSAVPGLLLGQTAERPDILFISIDDLNDWVSPLDGHPQARTPNMERLAERGLLFTNAHSPAVVCNASRTSLLTGLRPSTTGVYFNQNPWLLNERATSVRTLPGYFMDSGYRTVGAGKVFHSGNNDRTAWNVYYPSLDRDRPDDATPSRLPRNNNPFGGSNFDWFPNVAEDAAMGDGQLADWTARQLLAAGGEPRFQAVGFRRPHQPWYVPQKYFDMHPIEDIRLPPTVENDLDDVPDAALRGNFVVEGSAIDGQTGETLHQWVLDNDQWPAAVQGYLASISFADAMLGRVLDGLDESGRAGNTILVVFGDHGFHVGEKWTYAKKSLWRESTRVALFIVAPSVTRPGTETSAPVSLLDLYPTLTELAGLPAPAHLEGTSLVPLLEDPEAKWDRPVLTTNGYRNHSVTGDRYQYIRWSDGSEELYDFLADPHEFTNRADDPGLKAVKRELAEWFPDYDAPDIRAPRER